MSANSVEQAVVIKNADGSTGQLQVTGDGIKVDAGYANYQSATFLGNASEAIVAAVTGKVIKVHYLDIQTQGTVTVEIQDSASNGNNLDEYSLQTREGAIKGFAPYPAYHYKSQQGQALYANLSASVRVKICVIYSAADSS